MNRGKNVWGWFGTQIGFTLWILVCSVILLDHDSLISFVLFCLFIFVNVLGCFLYKTKRLNKLTSMCCSVSIYGISALVSVYVLEVSGNWSIVSNSSDIKPENLYSQITLLTLFLLVLFYFVFKQGDKQRQA